MHTVVAASLGLRIWGPQLQVSTQLRGQMGSDGAAAAAVGCGWAAPRVPCTPGRGLGYSCHLHFATCKWWLHPLHPPVTLPCVKAKSRVNGGCRSCPFASNLAPGWGVAWGGGAGRRVLSPVFLGTQQAPVAAPVLRIVPGALAWQRGNSWWCWAEALRHGGGGGGRGLGFRA